MGTICVLAAMLLPAETTFHWDEQELEVQIVNPRHPTYAPLAANRCWALVPTGLEGPCFVVDTPSFSRILRRIGLYISTGQEAGPLAHVLKDMRTFYGADYLRLSGSTTDATVQVRFFPDLRESAFYLVTDIKNVSTSRLDVSVMLAADFEFHGVHWASHGFLKPQAPSDDRVTVLGEGTQFLVSDSRGPGVAVLSSKKPHGWNLARSSFDFDKPSFPPGTANETESEDGFCLVHHVLSIEPGERQTLPMIIGYQRTSSPEAIASLLENQQGAFEETKAFYQKPAIGGVRIETPDPVINAQFGLYTTFVKMAEHKHGTRHVFLPGAHYHNWACPRDFFQAVESYVFMNDWDILTDSMSLYRSLQCPNGRIPEGVALWSGDDGSEAARNLNPDIKNTIEYIRAACKYVKFKRDRDYAASILPSLKRAVAAVRECKIDGLIAPGCNYGFDRADYPGGFGDAPQTYTSAGAYKSLIDLAELSAWLGNHGYAEELTTEAEQLKQTINANLWLPERGYYRIGLTRGPVGKDENDKRLFNEEMLGIGNINVVEWGVAEGERARRVLENVKGRLYTPHGVRFLDPPWVPSYTDNRGITYEAGRVQQGGLWPLAINDLVRAEIKAGLFQGAFAHFRELRIDRMYSRVKLQEEGKESSFICPMEWVDTDLTMPVTSVLFLVTSSTWAETLLEHILGIKVGYEEIQVKPALPPSWDGAKISRVKVGESEWEIEIRGNGDVKTIFVDGTRTERIKITPGRHRVTVDLAGDATPERAD